MLPDLGLPALDEWTRWFLLTDLAATWPLEVLFVVSITLSGGALLQYRRVRRHAGCVGTTIWLLAAITMLVISLASAWLYADASSHVLARLDLAKKLGVPPPHGRYLTFAYPLDARLASIVGGVTTRDQVHELLGQAKAIYSCLPRDARGNRTDDWAEKYAFFGEGVRNRNVLVVNVYYDANGVAKEVVVPESVDELPLRYCTRN